MNLRFPPAGNSGIPKLSPKFRGISRGGLWTLLGVLVLLLVWELAARAGGSEMILPGPLPVFRRFFQLVQTAPFHRALAYSFFRVFLGLAIAVPLGLGLGIMTGLDSRARAFFRPLFQIVSATPVMAVILIAFLWFGQERTPVFTAFLMVFPVMAANTAEGIRAVDSRLVEMVKVYDVPRPRRLRALYLPAIVPFIVGGLRSSLSLCWKVVAAAEVLVQPLRALGTGMQRARAHLETAELFAWTAAAVLAAAAAQGLLTLALFLAGLRRKPAGAFFPSPRFPAEGQGRTRLPGVSIRGLNFSYGDNRIFEDFNLELGKENPAVILGPSGCGKTTLLFLIARLLKPAGGEIAIDGGAADGHVPAVLVFQEPRLLPWMTALENVSLPLRRFFGKKPALERARYFLELAGLGDKIHNLPRELSGGQRQRVSLARAFAVPGPVILLDEPFQSLDIPLKITMMDLVMTLLNREQGRQVIAVTHDPREAVYLGRRILALGKPGPAVPSAFPPAAVVFDEILPSEFHDRSYGS
ncbi:MAG: ATP-binding cassette domain-containing protein, partial [Treponema sp.]|nr:ATP-binding cassette domain-containing protein [Treponema sp.]